MGHRFGWRSVGKVLEKVRRARDIATVIDYHAIVDQAVSVAGLGR